MIISAFGMCCGYYEKIKNNKISPKEFYSKRIKRILPFFIVVTLIEIIFNHNLQSLGNGLFNITLTRGLIPEYQNDVIGVGWFIGTIFLFYMIFPYYVYLLDNKVKSWIVLMISLLLNAVCIKYTSIGSSNLLYSFPYFVSGGVIFMYKEEIARFIQNKKILSLITIIVLTILFFALPNNKYLNVYKYLILYSSYIIFAISVETKILNNKLFNYIGKEYTFQIYLSHMIIFRLIEKLHLLSVFSNDIINYILVCVATFVGSFVFSYIIEKILKRTKVAA